MEDTQFEPFEDNESELEQEGDTEVDQADNEGEHLELFDDVEENNQDEESEQEKIRKTTTESYVNKLVKGEIDEEDVPEWIVKRGAIEKARKITGNDKIMELEKKLEENDKLVKSLVKNQTLNSEIKEKEKAMAFVKKFVKENDLLNSEFNSHYKPELQKRVNGLVGKGISLSNATKYALTDMLTDEDFMEITERATAKAGFKLPTSSGRKTRSKSISEFEKTEQKFLDTLPPQFGGKAA